MINVTSLSFRKYILSFLLGSCPFQTVCLSYPRTMCWRIHIINISIPVQPPSDHPVASRSQVPGALSCRDAGEGASLLPKASQVLCLECTPSPPSESNEQKVRNKDFYTRYLSVCLSSIRVCTFLLILIRNYLYCVVSPKTVTKSSESRKCFFLDTCSAPSKRQSSSRAPS